MTRWLALLAAAAALAALAGTARALPRDDRLTVFAAASLIDVFPRIDPAPRYSFGGSDTLAAQIANGAPADVYAAASPTLPDRLYKQGLLEQPIVFTTNRLVLVVDQRTALQRQAAAPDAASQPRPDRLERRDPLVELASPAR